MAFLDGYTPLALWLLAGAIVGCVLTVLLCMSDGAGDIVDDPTLTTRGKD